MNAGDLFFSRCGNVASILELDEHLAQEYKVFHHAAVVRCVLFCRFMNQLWFMLSYPGYESSYH